MNSKTVTKPIVLADLISELRDTFPELTEPLRELQDGGLLENGDIDFIFSYVFNPFLKTFLSFPNDAEVGGRIFHFLERMAKSPDRQLLHVLSATVFGSLTPEELPVAEKYIGSKTNEKRKSMWNREEFEAREKYRSECFGRYGGPVVEELEYQYNFKFDPDSRSFIEEIGNITCHDFDGYRREIIVAGKEAVKVERSHHEQPLGIKIMVLGSESYILYRDGSIKVFEALNDRLYSTQEKRERFILTPLLPPDFEQVFEYRSLAHLVDELLDFCHPPGQKRRKPAKERLSARRKRRSRATARQVEAYGASKSGLSLEGPNNCERHRYRGSLTISNVWNTLFAILPELVDDTPVYDLEDWNWLDDLLNPLCNSLSNGDPIHPIFGHRLFRFLEKMALSPDIRVRNMLVLEILNFLNREELEEAKKYIGPKTRELSDEFEEFLSNN